MNKLDNLIGATPWLNSHTCCAIIQYKRCGKCSKEYFAITKQSLERLNYLGLINTKNCKVGLCNNCSNKFPNLSRTLSIHTIT